MNHYKILLADDDVEDRYIIATAFKEIGRHETVHFVENGEEVLSYLQSLEPEQLPSLIVLDLNMPRMNGREILEVLKKNALYKDIQVIIFSTSLNETERRECMALGAISYITKPVKYQDSLAIAQQFYDYCSSGASAV